MFMGYGVVWERHQNDECCSIHRSWFNPVVRVAICTSFRTHIQLGPLVVCCGVEHDCKGTAPAGRLDTRLMVHPVHYRLGMRTLLLFIPVHNCQQHTENAWCHGGAGSRRWLPQQLHRPPTNYVHHQSVISYQMDHNLTWLIIQLLITPCPKMCA